MKKAGVYFVADSSGLGSSIMRGKFIAQYLSSAKGLESSFRNILTYEEGSPPPIHFVGRDISRIPNNSIVVVIKSIKMIAKIRENKTNTIIYDVIDQLCSLDVKTVVDNLVGGGENPVAAVISCTQTIQNQFVSEFGRRNIKPPPKLFVINHHWDPIFDAGGSEDERRRHKFEVGYFGDKSWYGNGLKFLKELTEGNHVKVFDTISLREKGKEVIDGEVQKEGVMIPYFPMHISVRDDKWKFSKLKPATKVSTAAAAGSNIIISRDDGFMELLPPNYPYILKDTELKTILKMIDYARKTYNTEVWDRGLEMMKRVKDMTSIETIIPKYIQMFIDVTRPSKGQ